MNWEAIGAIGEVTGALGVIVTLGYLAYQIRQNTVQLEQSTRSAKAAAVNASNIALRDTRQSIFASGETAEIFRRGNSSPRDLSELEELRYRLVIQNVTEVMVDIYTQTAVTGFSPETWETQGKSLVRRVLGTAGGRWFWSSYSDNYPAAFQAEVDEILAEGGAGVR